jgi:hypothetical protein
MSPLSALLEAEGAAQISRAVVMGTEEDGAVMVERESAGSLECDVLSTADGACLHLETGDAVLVWAPAEGTGRGVVLGRIGGSRAAAVPDELVIEARKNLTIRCGEGSITLRGDGKVLIKGKDLVSRAQRMNRVKGGAVAIN